jgi:hypothetical protein
MQVTPHLCLIISSGADVEDCLIDVIFLFDFYSYPFDLRSYSWPNRFMNDVAEELEAIAMT